MAHHLLENVTKMNAGNLKSILLASKEPLVFQNYLDWGISKWYLQDWERKLGDTELTFRKGSVAFSSQPQWESKTPSQKGTFAQFLKHAENAENEWLYFDYKYLREWFLDLPDLQKDVDWSKFGYPDLKCEDSTIWIGSKCSHTPCHMDSYGFNLVAQIFGTKRWIFYPPEENLLPTRIPYEESSIYSKINFFSPSNKSIRFLQGKNSCRTVVLHPGDVLFVPNGWWHYVESLETSISINAWVPLESDDEKRLEEALVEVFVSKFGSNCPKYESSSSLDVLETCLRICKDKKVKNSKKHDLVMELKRSFNLEAFLEENRDIIKRIPVLTGKEYLELLEGQRNRFDVEERREENVPKNIDEILLECMTHPDVVALIKNKLFDCS